MYFVVFKWISIKWSYPLITCSIISPSCRQRGRSTGWHVIVHRLGIKPCFDEINHLNQASVTIRRRGFYFIDSNERCSAGRLVVGIIQKVRDCPRWLNYRTLEIRLGILLGLRCWARVAPDFTNLSVGPPKMLEWFWWPGALGFWLLLFQAGMEINLKTIRKSRHAAAAISLSDLHLPFITGFVASCTLHTAAVSIGVEKWIRIPCLWVRTLPLPYYRSRPDPDRISDMIKTGLGNLMMTASDDRRFYRMDVFTGRVSILGNDGSFEGW